MPSEVHVALLRGINVGGKNIIPMAALAQTFERMKFSSVKTFIASGNVIFAAPKQDLRKLEVLESGRLPIYEPGLRDLIARRHEERAVATMNADETVLTALQRMKLYDVSQLPVLKDGRIVGIVDEEDILLEVYDNPAHFAEPVTEAMESHLVTVPPSASVEQLMEIFNRGLVAIVVDGNEFLGLITRIDFLNWLRRRTQQ